MRTSCRTTRSATSDIEYLFPIGWQELEGVANRGDYDLRQHTEHSGTTLEWIGHEERYVPYVIEPALGVGRAFLTFLCDAYDEEVVADRPRTVLRLHPRLAPVKAAVLPLIGKDTAMVEQARGLYVDLRKSMSAEYDDAAAIGKRYRRQDEIGTPWALTIDEQTLADGTVTLRDRDTLQQERIPIDGAERLLLDKLEQPWLPRSLSWQGTPSTPTRCTETGSAIRMCATSGSGRRRTAAPLPDGIRAALAHALGAVVVQRRAVRAVVSGRHRRLSPDAVVVLVDGWTSVGGSQWIDSPGIGAYGTYLCDEVVAVRRRALSDERCPRRCRASRPAATARS